jgi:hypothetical protein
MEDGGRELVEESWVGRELGGIVDDMDGMDDMDGGR